MKRWVSLGSAALLMFAFTACHLGDLTDLEVINQNNPDRERALTSPGDIEALISNGYFLWHRAVYQYEGNTLSSMGDEGSSSWGNYGSREMSSEPRVAWPNSPSFAYNNATEYPWYRNYEALSSVYDGLKAIEADPSLCNDIDCDRAHAFAKFSQGLALGYLGLQFDKGFILDESVDLETDSLPFYNYPDLIDKAVSYMQDAISEASGASWSLPSAWIRGNAWSTAELVRYIHAHIARLLYQEAREPAEHAAADWPGIIAHVNAGITADVFLEGDIDEVWWQALNYFGNQISDGTWHRADYKSIGWTSTDNGYANWLAASLNDRTDFILSVADERITAPGDGTQDGLDFVFVGASDFPASRGTYHYSMYMNSNYTDYAEDESSPMPQMLYVTQQLMKAEGLARTGDLNGAADIVDITRVGRANLSPANRTDLGTLLQQIWYEHLIENYYVCTGCAFFPRRGWQAETPTGPNHHFGLVEGTPLHFPVPGKELELLQLLNYTYGGVGGDVGGTLPGGGGASGVRPSVRVPARAVYAFNGLDTPRDKLDYIHREMKRPSRGVTNLVRH